MQKMVRQFLSKSSADRDLLKQADRARDDEKWTQAVTLYSDYLKRLPEHQAIWVQLGHAFKEDGLPLKAMKAYEQAIELDPHDMDVRLHLAHLAKKSGNLNIAIDNFMLISEATRNDDVLAELASLGITKKVSSPPRNLSRSGHVTFVEVGDLLSHMEHHTTLTGISRVVSAIVDYMASQNDKNYVPVAWDRASDRFLTIPSSLMKKVVDFASGDAVWIDTLRTLIAEARRSAVSADFKAGDIYVMPGAFWQIGQDQSFFSMLKDYKVKIAIYIYDLIPLTHSNFCEASFSMTFSSALAEVAPFVDFYLTISSYVADELKKVLARSCVSIPPIVPVALAHSMLVSDHNTAQVHSKKIDFLIGRKFVLCVCTIEARKNHSFLVDVWQKMIDDDLIVPDLVFVGRVGWRVHDLMGRLAESQFLRGKVHILQNVSDIDLVKLYETSMFTAFPSFVEGWGLPVGESLAHGKVCLASSASSIPEVGGDLVSYFDPYNMPQGVEIFRKVIEDRQHRLNLERRICEEFKPRTWNKVAEEFFTTIDKLYLETIASSSVDFAPCFPSGTIVYVAEIFEECRSGIRYLQNPTRLLFRQGWHSVESMGTWMSQSRADLSIKTEYQPNMMVFIIIHIQTSPWIGSQNSLSVKDFHELNDDDFETRKTVRVPLKPNTSMWVRSSATVDDNGILRLALQIDGEIVADSPHMPLGIRLDALGYCLKSDLDSRLQLIESITFGLR